MAWRCGVGADSRAHRAAARPASGDPLAPVHQCRGGQRALHELLPEEPAARLAAGGAWDGVPRDLHPGAAARLAAQPACGRLDPRSRLAFDHRRDGVQPIEPSLEASTTLGMGASEAVARIGLITLDIGSGNYAEACALARQLIDMDVIHIHSRLL